MAALETILQQALALSDEERSELVVRLLRSLEPDGDSDLTQEEWRAAWTDEIDRRLREVRAGKVELVEGDEVFRKARARIAAHRR